VEEIGLFPLGIVLLPGERVPLHIFEPRYRELIGECLELEREFGLVFADDDGMRRVGTRAAVVDVLERFDDGRLNVVIEGRERFELQGLTGGRSFQTGDVEPLVDDGGGPSAEQVEQTLAVLRRVADLAEAELDQEVLSPSGDTPSFELAARVTLEPKLKQQLLEQRSEPARLKRLAELLEAAAKALQDRQAAAKLAAGNGRLRRG
jgi:Lon protease-like protein